MSDFLKSAFDYFGSGTKSKSNNELVGNCIEIGNQSFKVLHTIAEGGFSVVFEAQDIKTNKCYALKRLISHDAETNKEIMQEINFLKKLHGHPNIIQLFTAASIGQERQRHVGTDFLIVTELCIGGQVIQLMQRRNKVFPYSVTLQIFNHVALAIEHMHNQNPPIIHRDLKVENLLISCHGVIKLCDFGSATTIAHYPDSSWTGLKRSEVQEEIEKHTTPMYRTPEMLDLYQNYPINQACDIWALGCVLYYLCFNKHPFEDSAKLAILNANYSIPANSEINDSCCGLIYQMLLIDPIQRPRIIEILNEVRVQASVSKITLGSSITFDKESLNHLPPLKPLPTGTDEISPKRSIIDKPLPPRPPPCNAKSSSKPQPKIQSKMKIHPTATSPTQVASLSENSTVVQNKSQQLNSNIPTTAPNIGDGKKMFGMIKEGAGNIMKNIRDASNKVIEQVSSSINKTDLDLTYITSRIIMMPTPGEAGIDILTRDKIDDVQTFLDFRHPNQYYIYNLSLRSIKTEKFNDRVMQLGFDAMKPMSLNNLVTLCIHQLQWLSADPKNVIVVQCSDGRVGSGMNVAALLCFCRLVDTSSAAADIVKFRRENCNFTASHLRYIDYVCRLVRTIEEPSIGPDIPHKFIVKLTGIEIEPVPIFNRAKTGVRPYVEVFNDYKLVYSNLKNYEDLSLFTYDHKNARISIPNINVCGDLNIVLYHTRSNIVSKGKISSFKICEVQIYTGYLTVNTTEIALTRNNLDHLDSDHDKYPVGFTVKIQLNVTQKEETNNNQVQSFPWNSNKFKSDSSRFSRDDMLLPFNNKDELKACMMGAGLKLPMKDIKITPTKAKENRENFFESLDWNSSPVIENNDISVHSSPSKSESLDCNNCVENSNNSNRVVSNNYVNQEAVGNLLGDFGTDDNEIIEEPNIQIQNNDVDGLVDFLSAFPEPNTNEFSMINDDMNLFNGSTTTNETSDVNLLFFDSTNEKSNNFQFDPFGHNLVNSSSSTNLTSNDWLNSSPALSQLPQTTMKPSNSTNSLLNIVNSNPVKHSPSFNANQSQQKSFGSDFNVFGNTPKEKFEIPPKSKPVPPPKPSVDKKVFENVQSKKPKDAFQDLLGDFKPNESSANGPRTMRDIRKEKLSKTTDPETMKILDWVEGKEKNIRALLCTLPSILWPEVKWSGVSMSELVTVDQVKKAYRNAVRCVHPDKWNNTEHENFSKMIMIELNEAMTEFEAEKTASNN